MENIADNNDYDLIEEVELIADNRLTERAEFIKDSTWKIAKSLIDGEVDLEEANRVMEKVGEDYPLSLEEMASMINKVHTAHHLGCIETPKKNETPTDAKAWSTLLARLNPKYTIFTDDEGDVSLGLREKE